MALEREDAPFHLSHWGIEETVTTPQRMPGLDSQMDSPLKDSIMTDETEPASTVDVQMILESNELDLEDSPVLPSVVVPPPIPQGGELDGQRLPEAQLGPASPHPLTHPLVGNEQTSNGSQSPAMLAPTATFTPRRSPRASTSASSSRANSAMPEATAFTSPTTPTLHARGPNRPQPAHIRAPVPERIQAPAFFREGFISSAMPSPSLFQVTNEGSFSERQASAPQSQPFFGGAVTEDALPESTVPTVENHDGPTESGDYAEVTTHHPHTPEMDMKMDETDGESSPTRSQATDMSPDSSPISGLPITPSSLLKTPRGLQFPSSTTDLSTLFASPVPQLSQPVLSPFRLHQSFQPFSIPPPAVQSPSTPPPITPPPQEPDHGDMSMRPVFPMQSSPSKDAAGSVASPHFTMHPAPPETPGKSTPQDSNDIRQGEFDGHGNSLMQEIQTTTTTMTPTRSSNVLLNHSTPPMHPSQTSQGAAPLTHPATALQGSLTPLLGPVSLARLPFPITPQRSSRADFFTPVRDRPEFFAPVGNNPQASIPNPAHGGGDIITTPSRIPISVSTPGKGTSLLDDRVSPLANFEGAVGPQRAQGSPAKSNLLSPSTTSQLRQPSNLRNTAGAASRIPRPGRKPYSKPISRLPKPKLAAKVLSPVSVSSVASSKVSSITTPMSPIKTRRGRANQASTSAAMSSRSAVLELPPDAIIYEPPPPRIRPKFDDQEPVRISDEEGVAIEVDGDLVSARASPPVETGFSPPKSGLFLKSESRRLKKEVAINPPGSVIPQFSATAPSLGIFPSLSRPKGKGKNTLIRPMMMPLDPTSLRNLTTSNTLRNQHYVCSKVETKVIMREGKRPASPTTKVKTILEKKKEEQEKSREERAARRIGKAGQTNGHDHEMTDSMQDPANRKHPRGAGDDEDYETPTKPERTDMDMDEDEGTRKRKRVKWDKDLLQRFELDETNMEGIRKAAELAKERMATKGCLAAQVLLDPLGNVPQADVPIANLAKEQVVVTRVIYIEDLPPSERPKRVAAAKANARINVGTP